MHRTLLVVTLTVALLGCGGHGRPTHADTGTAGPRASGAPIGRQVSARRLWHASMSAPCWQVDYRWTDQVRREIATVPRGRGMPTGTGCKRFAHHGSTSHWRLTYWDR